jgi:prolyl-tRNA synthetase
MKDAYSFDLDGDKARAAYNRMFVSYLKTFARMGLTAIPMEANTGPIGGDMSHEFIILAETGESGVFFHKDWMNINLDADIDYNADLQPFVDKFTSLYARADDMHDAENCPVAADDLMSLRGIEIGHIFYFGTKYSETMGATVSGPDGKPVPVHMGSYGIGVSRLVGGIIEASHDDKGIIWPDAVTPFGVAIVNLKPGDALCDGEADRLYQQFDNAGLEPLLDDRNDRPGAKMASMDLIGIPWQIVVGPRGMENNMVEVKRRKTGETAEMSPDSAVTKILNG